MVIINKATPLAELHTMAERTFGDLVKAVVDVKRGIMAVDGELHSDEEAMLIEDGSGQDDLWGINIYPAAGPDERLEFDSLINIKPWQGNRSRGVENAETRARIEAIVRGLIAE